MAKISIRSTHLGQVQGTLKEQSVSRLMILGTQSKEKNSQRISKALPHCPELDTDTDQELGR